MNLRLAFPLVPVVFLAALTAPPAPAQTVDEIISKHIEARGGREKLGAVKSIRMTGTMTMGGTEVPFVLEMKRPNMMRLDMTVQGTVGTQVFDGSSGWVVMPFAGITDPDPMPDDVVAEAQAQADFDGPLVDYAAKGHKVHLGGKEAVEGKDAYKIEVTLKSGTTRRIYIDAATFMEVKSEGARTIGGETVENETFASDYRKVDGLMFPFVMQTGLKGSSDREKMTVEKIEVNVPIDDARFKAPGKKAAGN
jgi:outer membrane lipoprotein-sorting protein